jgi:uncharacterized membrane protein
MTWFILARTLFIAAIAFTSGLLQPLAGFGLAGGTSGMVVNGLFGLVLALLIIIFEVRLKDVAVTTTLGALLGGATGLVIARTMRGCRSCAASSSSCCRTSGP